MKLYTLDNQFIEETNDWPDNFTGIVVHDNGTKHWYVDGERHRIGGPAIEYPDGAKQWFFNNQFHRIDGPAVEYPDGTKYWYVDGKPHRIGGPACEYPDGTKYWFIHGKEITEQEHDLLYSIMKLKGLL